MDFSFPRATSFRWGRELATGNTCAHQTENFLPPSPTSFLPCSQSPNFRCTFGPFGLLFRRLPLLTLFPPRVFSCRCLRPRVLRAFPFFFFLHSLPYRLLSFLPLFHLLCFVARLIHQSQSALGSSATCPPSNPVCLTSSLHLRRRF